MTRSEAITALYALFNAPHNADINLVGLNVLLDELYKSHPQEEPWPEEPEGHIAGGVHPPQRQWVGLTDEDKQDWIKCMPWPPEPGHIMVLIEGIESELKELNR